MALQKLVLSLSHFYLEDKASSLPLWFAKTLAVSEFERRLSNDAFKNFVCIEHDVIVGYLSIKDRSHIYHLFVTGSHQGRGIATALWHHATSDADIRRYTVRSSLYAVPVYKRFGFQALGQVSGRDGVCFQLMELLL